MAGWNETDEESVRADLARIRDHLREVENRSDIADHKLYDAYLAALREEEASIVALLAREGVTA